MAGELDAGNPHVQFDEGVRETCDNATRLCPTLPKRLVMARLGGGWFSPTDKSNNPIKREDHPARGCPLTNVVFSFAFGPGTSRSANGQRQCRRPGRVNATPL